MKKCKCGETDASKFYPSQKATCKACNRKRQDAWKVAHPERWKEIESRALSKPSYLAGVEARKEASRQATRMRHERAGAEHAEEQERILCSCKVKSGRCLRDGRDPKKAMYASRAWKAAKTALLIKQGGRCAACGTSNPGRDSQGRMGWHLDHNHETRALRGVLCMQCNTGIGLAGESHERLASWSTYLQQHTDSPGETIVLPSNQRGSR